MITKTTMVTVQHFDDAVAACKDASLEHKYHNCIIALVLKEAMPNKSVRVGREIIVDGRYKSLAVSSNVFEIIKAFDGGDETRQQLRDALPLKICYEVTE